MKNFAKLPVEDRKEVFQAVAGNMGLRPDIIEKDFWVCFMLNHLFHECKYREAFVFKGGTSLSKTYHVIKRFSEDIDIILDWRKLIPENDRPWDERSKTQQDKYNKLVNKNAAIFYREELVPAEYIMDDVKSDYVAMKNMIYGEYPYFDDIIDCLTKLETEVHALS